MTNQVDVGEMSSESIDTGEVAKLPAQVLLEECSIDNVPPSARQEFDNWGSPSLDLRLSEHAILRASFSGPAETFIATYDTGETDRRPRSTQVFLADVGPDNELVGLGLVVLLGEAPHEHSGPFVQWTKTMPGSERLGLGLQRLVTMNEVTKRLFGDTLESGDNMKPEVERQWQRLEAAGLAAEHGDEYKFVG